MERELLEEKFKNINKTLDKIVVSLEKQDEVLERVESKVTVTNGRVTSLEQINKDTVLPVVQDYIENRAQARGAWKLWTLFGGVLFTIVCFSFKIYMEEIKKEIINETIIQSSPVISDSVYNKLEKEYNINIK